MVWFNFAPLLQMVKETLGLSTQEVKTLLILNVALTIPARVIIGMLTDRFGPRLVYSALLAVCSIPCFMFAFADSFMQAAIARFMLGFIGAGFVVGIRLVSEWFPHNELGTAEGIYGGWGNFGSAAAAFTLPMWLCYLVVTRLALRYRLYRSCQLAVLVCLLQERIRHTKAQPISDLSTFLRWK
ncbi:nitrate/nitrite transporter [Vibrio sp. JCM 19236]|nr:nitrate/nitrite transporter [Vibrio sp. JCM 19236]